MRLAQGASYPWAEHCRTTLSCVQHDCSHRGLHLLAKRQLIEQVLTWNETTGRVCQVMTHGPTRVCHVFVLSTTAYNLTRILTLEKASLQMA